MKTKNIAALVVALGILSPGAFAQGTPISPAPATERSTSAPQSPDTGDPTRVAAAPEPTAKQIAQLECIFNAKYHANDGLAQQFADRIRPATHARLDRVESPTVVFSEPPSPAFSYDSHALAYWYPSVSFHFDWGRNRRS